MSANQVLEDAQTVESKSFNIDRSFIDIPTTLIIALMVVGFPIVAWLQYTGAIHWSVAMIIGTFLMNISFTAWHEPSHGNYSTSRLANHIAGIVSSFSSVYPGYFARRREHLAHHKWEGTPGKDPVYARIQKTNIFLFPFKLIYINFINKNPVEIPDSFCKYTNTHRVLDHLNNLIALAVVLVAAFYGWFWPVMCSWVIPRGLFLFIHAYYICFFAHGIDDHEGFQVYRVKKANLLWRFLTMEQNFHGLHHRFPFIPWHKYANIVNKRKDILEDSRFEVIE